MKVFFLLFFAFLGPLASAEEIEDLCSNPVHAVCSEPFAGPKVADGKIRAAAKKIAEEKLGKEALKDLLFADDPTAEDHIENYLVYLNAHYQAVLEELKKIGITEQAINERVTRFRGHLSSRVAEGKGPDNKPFTAYTDSQLSQLVSGIQLMTAKKLANSDPELPILDAVRSHFKQCGVDGMVRQAFYSPRDNKFTLCAGMLMNMLDAGSIAAADMIYGHEMAHSFDPNSYPSIGLGKVSSPPLWERYRGMMTCVQKNYAQDFDDLLSASNTLIKKIVEPARVSIQDLQSQPILDEQAYLEEKRKVAAFVPMAKTLRDRDASFRKRLGRAPTIGETHAGELSADQNGIGAMTEELRLLAPEERSKVVKASLRWLCKDPDSKEIIDLKYRTIRSDGLHPPSKWRIENALRNPVLRTELGCKKAAEQPWCTFSGNNALVAACGPPQDKITDAQDCKASIARQLKAAECEASSLGCKPMKVARFVCEIESPNCSGSWSSVLERARSYGSSNSTVPADGAE